ncbi:MAG: ParA family protein [Clostridia bacterium]|nr:ParA family protein [Clostridia bacterium]
MGHIIALANQKGGVGKTTSAVNIAASLGRLGKKTLLVDSDPQGNATSGVGVGRKQLASSLYDALIGRVKTEETVIKTQFDNLYLCGSDMSLAAAEFELVNVDNRESRMKNALDGIKDSYDYIIIDCPPSLGILTINSLCAADGVIIPMQCEYYALEGLSQLIMTIRRVKQLYNPKIDITGILITMYNGRLSLSIQVLNELKKYYADKIFSSSVPRNVRLSEAPSHGKPIYYYDRNSRGSWAYLEVAEEIVERVEK